MTVGRITSVIVIVVIGSRKFAFPNGCAVCWKFLSEICSWPKSYLQPTSVYSVYKKALFDGGLMCVWQYWTGQRSNRSNKGLVKMLETTGSIKSERIKDVMKQLDRGTFVPEGEDPYADNPVPIGYNATISAPHMHAECLQLLEEHLQPGMHALDVGSGKKYRFLLCTLQFPKDVSVGNLMSVGWSVGQNESLICRRTTICVSVLGSQTTITNSCQTTGLAVLHTYAAAVSLFNTATFFLSCKMSYTRH